MAENYRAEHQSLISQLCALGFTQLESEVYVYLLVHGASTGYAVAKGIGKAVANAYKAVESLSLKGAIKLSVENSKICHAVPWQQVLSTEQKRFDENISNLTEQLKSLPQQEEDESVYQLKNIDQVTHATSQMIEQAQTIIVAELEPKAAEYFAPSLQLAAKRGVEVRLKLYQPIGIDGAHITLRKEGEAVYAKTRDVSFKLCADGADSITAVLTDDFKKVIQSFKTKSSLVCMDMYCGIIYELILTELKQAIPQGDIKQCQQILKQTEHLHPFTTENKIFEIFKSRYQQ